MKQSDPSKCEPLDKNVRQRCEPLRAGDVIKYCSHLYVSGDERGNRVTTVLQVSTQGSPLLSLRNREYLGNETQIKRIFIVSGNETLDVTDNSSEGLWRRVDEFDLVKGCVRIEDLPKEHPGSEWCSNGGITGEVMKSMEMIESQLMKATAGDELASTMEVLHESQFSDPASSLGKVPLLHTNNDVGVSGKCNCVVDSIIIHLLTSILVKVIYSTNWYFVFQLYTI